MPPPHRREPQRSDGPIGRSSRHRSRAARRPLVPRAAAAALLALIAPVLGLIALGVRLSLGRPVLSRRTVGASEAAAEVLTFRTTGPGRSSKLGLLLRRWNLDELPVLMSAVRGEVPLFAPVDQGAADDGPDAESEPEDFAV